MQVMMANVKDKEELGNLLSILYNFSTKSNYLWSML